MISIYFSPPIARPNDTPSTHHQTSLHSSPAPPRPAPPLSPSVTPNTLHHPFITTSFLHFFSSSYPSSYLPFVVQYSLFAITVFFLPSSPQAVVNQVLSAVAFPLLTLLGGAVCTSLGEEPRERNSSPDFYFAVARDTDEAQTPSNSASSSAPRTY